MIALASLGALGSILRRPRGSARLRVGGRARRARHRGRATAAVAGRAARPARAARRPRSDGGRALVRVLGRHGAAGRGDRCRRRLGRARARRRPRGRDRARRSHSLVCIGMPHADLLRSARPAPARSALADRLTLGFVLRDLVRRRAAVAVHLASGRVAHRHDRSGRRRSPRPRAARAGIAAARRCRHRASHRAVRGRLVDPRGRAGVV